MEDYSNLRFALFKTPHTEYRLSPWHYYWWDCMNITELVHKSLKGNTILKTSIMEEKAQTHKMVVCV